eukprot:337687-Prorocentrum_lima.AAC.1
MHDKEKNPALKQALAERMQEFADQLPASKDPLDSLRDVLRTVKEVTAARSKLLEELDLIDRQAVELQRRRSQ